MDGPIRPLEIREVLNIVFRSFGYGAARRLSAINYSNATANRQSIEMGTQDGLPQQKHTYRHILAEAKIPKNPYLIQDKF